MLTYLLFLVPPMLLALLAQWMVHSAYRRMNQVPARMSGAEAARRILDSNGLYNVPIEQTPATVGSLRSFDQGCAFESGGLSRLHNVGGGIAAHEVGHALQDAKQYAPLVIRNLAVPAASFGSACLLYYC